MLATNDVRGNFYTTALHNYSKAKGAYSENNSFLASDQISDRAKSCALRSLVLSHVFYCSGLWPVFTRAQFSKLEAMHNNFWHNLFGNHVGLVKQTGSRLSTFELFTCKQIEPFAFSLLRARLRCFSCCSYSK